MFQNQLLEDLIQKAISKIHGKNEKQLCRFLPALKGYMHHFTFRKMMHENPQQLFDLIQKHVIEPDTPQEVQIQSIGQSYQMNRKIRRFVISEDEMDHILNIARRAQDLDLIEKLTSKESFLTQETVSFLLENL